ncbi:MAG: metal-dependent hydrolase [Nanoarchaeota archaeon]|nr:metal-dependent hydrolase [Nanoarchaeota archaeon]
MTQAATHLIVTLVLAQLIRDYWLDKKDKKKFPLYYVLLAGLAGLLPDLDVLVVWIAQASEYTIIHRTFSHTLFLPLIFIFLGMISTNWKGRKFIGRNFKWNYVFYILAFGVFVHLLLDGIFSGVIMPLYPLLRYEVGLNLMGMMPETIGKVFIPVLDAAVLTLWIIYLEFKHKISSFI